MNSSQQHVLVVKSDYLRYWEVRMFWKLDFKQVFGQKYLYKNYKYVSSMEYWVFYCVNQSHHRGDYQPWFSLDRHEFFDLMDVYNFRAVTHQLGTSFLSCHHSDHVTMATYMEETTLIWCYLVHKSDRQFHAEFFVHQWVHLKCYFFFWWLYWLFWTLIYSRIDLHTV